MQNRLTACGFSFLEPAPGGNVFYDFLKLKLKRNLTNFKLFRFFCCPSQKSFCPFRGPKKMLTNKFFISIFLLTSVLWNKRKVFLNKVKNNNF